MKASNRLQTREIVQRALLKMNGKSILKDFSYFTQVERAEALGRAHANCQSKGVATPRGDVKFDIDYGVRGCVSKPPLPLTCAAGSAIEHGLTSLSPDPCHETISDPATAARGGSLGR